MNLHQTRTLWDTFKKIYQNPTSRNVIPRGSTEKNFFQVVLQWLKLYAQVHIAISINSYEIMGLRNWEFLCHQMSTFRQLKKVIFFNLALKRPQNHVLFAKLPLYHVARHSSFNLRPLPGNLLHFQEI